VVIEHSIAVGGHRTDASKLGDTGAGLLYSDNATVIILQVDSNGYVGILEPVATINVLHGLAYCTDVPITFK
jgi:hypothetical protein